MVVVFGIALAVGLPDGAIFVGTLAFLLTNIRSLGHWGAAARDGTVLFHVLWIAEAFSLLLPRRATLVRVAGFAVSRAFLGVDDV